ncbi:MAG TPA: HDIG domain-containing protein [Pyrinomonadaceae bacterium]
MSTKRPRFTTRLTKFRDALSDYVARPFRRLSPNTRFGLGFAALVIITTLLLAGNYSRGLVEDYREGDIVKRTIIAPADMGGVDIAETERRRDAARESVRPVFSFDPSRGDASAQELRRAWEDLQKQTEQQQRANNPGAKEPVWTGQGGNDVARVIVAHRFDPRLLDQVTRMIKESLDGYVYDDAEAAHLKGEITLVNQKTPDTQTVLAVQQSRLTPLSAARHELWARVTQLKAWTREDLTAIASATLPLLKPTLSFDEAATQAAEQTAANSVQPAAITLKRNQVVAREGDTVTQPVLARLGAIRAYGRTGRPWHRLIGLFCIVAALSWAAWKFIEHRSTALALPLSARKAFALVASALVVETTLMRIGFTISDSIATQSTRAPLNDPTVWNFAIPFAAAALLVAMLVDTQLALITGVLTALFAGLLAPGGVPIAVYAVVSSSAAIYGIGRYRERQSVTLAGLVVGGVNSLMAVAVIAFAQQPLTLNTILLALACGLVGGLLAAVFTAGGLPINESMFGVLTDVKLLELSNADLPVLGQLAMRAPGTNQHSHAVGQLAEEACRAVGANPLLARIGALYHDIGKLAAPDYFVENQMGNNPHDRLRPSQSARIITSHVTYGLKLAREIGLPKQIADFIPQHHGTRTLHFFLRKAQAQAASGEEVDEAEFRYPGPKPQFKEAAVMMLADSCEAAARSLAHPNPENIRSIVTKIVDAIISDGQLDECSITLRELTTIRESVIASLTSLYHARIDYPGFNPPPLTGALPPLPRAELDSEERGVSYKRTSEIPINKAGEVEDEAVERKAAKR